jgi:hypothetical protein
MFEALIDRGYQVEFHSHARAILDVDFPAAASELESALAAATIPIEEISLAAEERRRAPSVYDGHWQQRAG